MIRHCNDLTSFMKKLLLTTIFSAFMTTAALGADLTVFINKIELETPIPPALKNDYTFLPLRSVAEALGFAVEYDAGERSIALEKTETKIKMTIGKTDVIVNGEIFSLPAEPYIFENYTLVPLRFISEAAGAKVEWIPEVGAFVYSNTAVPLKSGNGRVASALYEKNLGNVAYSIYIPEFYATGSQSLTTALNEYFEAFAEKITAAEIAEDETLIQNSDYEIFDGKKYLSVLSTVETYTGGAHGTYLETALTADIEAGKIISLADLFNETVDYKEFLLAYLKESWPKNPKYSEYFPVETFTPENFYIKDDLLIIFYQPYEMGPYSVGTVKFEIPFEDLEGIK